jgi:hypothetical protein
MLWGPLKMTIVIPCAHDAVLERLQSLPAVEGPDVFRIKP